MPHEVKVEHEDRHASSSGHYTRGKHVRVYYDESMSEAMEDTSREATPPRCNIFVFVCVCACVYACVRVCACEYMHMLVNTCILHRHRHKYTGRGSLLHCDNTYDSSDKINNQAETMRGIHTHPCMHACVHIHIYIYIYIYTYIHIYIYICKYIYSHMAHKHTLTLTLNL